MLQNGSITEHIHKTLVPAYTRRFSKLTSAIKQYLTPIGVALPSLSNDLPNGGFFIWLQLPRPLRGKEVAAAALLQGLTVGEGTSSALPDENGRYAEYEDMLRLCFACVDEYLLTEAIVILRRVIVECLASHAKQQNI
jgi:DNA-binding transcriptional MocR family regulator